jgi:hypothetical protein
MTPDSDRKPPKDKRSPKDRSADPPSPKSHIDDLLDEALEESFPASDPVAIEVEK